MLIVNLTDELQVMHGHIGNIFITVIRICYITEKKTGSVNKINMSQLLELERVAGFLNFLLVIPKFVLLNSLNHIFFVFLAQQQPQFLQSLQPQRAKKRTLLLFWCFYQGENFEALTPVTYLEEIKSPDGGVVQPHVLTQVQSGQVEGFEVGLIREQFKETHHCSQT